MYRFIIHTVDAVKAREKARELKRKRDEQQKQAKQHENGLFQKKSTHPPDGWGPFLTPPLAWIS